MQTVTYSRFGSPDVLTLSDVAPPSPRSGHLVVRVRAVSINPLDGKLRRGEARLLSGTKFPKTPGLDFAGVVEQVGQGVSGFQVGDDVFGGMASFKEGYLSERISVPARVVARLPKSLGSVRAAAVVVVGLAARAAVHAARIKAGDHVLIHGASGGLGPYALQLAKRAGAHVTAVTGTDGVALARELGADTVVDYRREAITASGRTFDSVLELSARLPFSQARVLLKPRGVTASSSPSPPRPPSRPWAGSSTRASCVPAPPGCSRSPSTGGPSNSLKRAAWWARSSSSFNSAPARGAESPDETRHRPSLAEVPVGEASAGDAGAQVS